MARKNTNRRSKGEHLEPVSAAVPPDLRRKLVEIANVEDRTLSGVVRIALYEFVQRRATAA